MFFIFRTSFGLWFILRVYLNPVDGVYWANTNQWHVNISNPADNAMQRRLVIELTGEGGHRRAILSEAGFDHHVFKPGTPSLVDMTFHL
ncbi:MAG: hypothetical protein KAS38_05345, partial [Anaerolineales bacterium]|nr:hypothetical protein [Anaerolineales bacterium]